VKRRFVLAGFLTAITDGIFASVQSLLRGSTVTHLWQAVAATLLGPPAMEGGTRTALIGIAMHFFVAFFWSAVFVFIVMRSGWIRAHLASRAGILQVAAVYGPCIWLVMSLIVIPLLVHRPPMITSRWWVQFFGHAIFVGLPIVAVSSRGSRLLVEPPHPLVDGA
jgi:hypothetical protein